jgi:hypothetical protein
MVMLLNDMNLNKWKKLLITYDVKRLLPKLHLEYDHDYCPLISFDSPLISFDSPLIVAS